MGSGGRQVTEDASLKETPGPWSHPLLFAAHEVSGFTSAHTPMVKSYLVTSLKGTEPATAQHLQIVNQDQFFRCLLQRQQMKMLNSQLLQLYAYLDTAMLTAMKIMD